MKKLFFGSVVLATVLTVVFLVIPGAAADDPEPVCIFGADRLDTAEGASAPFAKMTNTGEYITFTPYTQDPYYIPIRRVRGGRYVCIRYRSSDALGCVTQIYLGSAGNAPASEASMLKQEIISDGAWHTALFDTQKLISAGVYDGRTVSYLRFDVLEGADTSNGRNIIPAGASIDVEYIAFFDSKSHAERFDYKMYNKNREDALAALRAEQEGYIFPTPEYKKQQTVPTDYKNGTLKYTPSPDGKSMSISYELSGERVSYTVPNNSNYLFGGYRGTDDVGRSLSDSESVGSYKDGQRYVGIFYFLWHGEHGDNGIFDLQRIIDEEGVERASSLDCGRYGEVRDMHWFAEPLYGYYYARDEWVVRKHMELLTQANVDFLYFDVTNSYEYLNNALTVMRVLHSMNEEGYDAPQVVFYTHTNAQKTVRNIYNSVYKLNKYKDTWFCLDGKPVIVSPEDVTLPDGRNITEFFTVKREQWPNDPNYNDNAWPWMDFEWPQRIFTDKQGAPSAVSVSVAQHSGTIRFTSSSLYANHTNRGRSFTNPSGYASTDSRFDTVLSSAYNAWKNDRSRTDLGLNFAAQFEYALKSDAKFILVTGWNEWVAQRIATDDSSVYFVDTASEEFSRDIEMMRGGYFDNYYMQLAENIQRAKGTAPIVVQDSRRPINLTGSFSQWDDVLVSYTDPSGDASPRACMGFGNQMLKNNTGRNDFTEAKVTSDTKNLYFYAKTAKNITKYNDITSWMQIYVNSDADASTGWYGYDHIINYRAKDAFTTSVAKYTGKIGEYAFEEIGEISYRVSGNEIMICVPQSMLSIKNYRAIELEFKWADGECVYESLEDFYVNGDTAPLGRMNFVYQNYIKGRSDITSPETPDLPAQTEDTDASYVPDTSSIPDSSSVGEISGTAAPDTSNEADTTEQPAVPESTGEADSAESRESTALQVTDKDSSGDERKSRTCVPVIAAAALTAAAFIAGIILHKKKKKQ